MTAPLIIADCTILTGDCRDRLRELPAGSVQTCITSPPYFGLRDYQHAVQIGLEPSPEEFVAALVDVFREVRRVLRDDGTLWLNLGDSYAGSGRGGHVGDKSTLDGNRFNQAETRRARKTQAAAGYHEGQVKAGAIGRAWVPPSAGFKTKDLMGMPWRVAFALQADGWYLRQDIIWHKPNPMPESVADRCTKAHEYIFLLSKSERYYFDHDAITEQAARPEGAANKSHKGATAYAGGDEKMRTKVGLTEIGPRNTRNKRSVWTISTKPFSGAHFATYPPDLVEPCVLAGAPAGGVVLDPFGGAGSTAIAPHRHGRKSILVELNPVYVTDIMAPRLREHLAQSNIFGALADAAE